MKGVEALIVLLVMCVPFIAIKSTDLATYLYWTVVSALYLIYVALKRW
ncbi:MAG: hypothetical protein ACK401_03805 [Archaeoglobaceae archaeon]